MVTWRTCARVGMRRSSAERTQASWERISEWTDLLHNKQPSSRPEWSEEQLRHRSWQKQVQIQPHPVKTLCEGMWARAMLLRKQKENLKSRGSWLERWLGIMGVCRFCIAPKFSPQYSCQELTGMRDSCSDEFFWSLQNPNWANARAHTHTHKHTQRD